MATPKTLTELLIILKIRLALPEGDDMDALLTVLAEQARDKILAYTNRPPEKWRAEFDGAAIDLALSEYAKMGAEGYASRTEGAVSTSFDTEGDAKILAPLAKYRIAGV